MPMRRNIIARCGTQWRNECADVADRHFVLGPLKWSTPMQCRDLWALRALGRNRNPNVARRH